MAAPMIESRLDLMVAYRQMLTIRRFEERVLELRLADQISGSVHLSGGQEAIPVGALAALEPDDRVIATYRGHGWAIACEIPLLSLFAETLGRASGTNGGRAGSAYLSSPEHRFLGENSIVGAGLPIANGVALAAQLSGSGRVAIASFGDGATSQGATHEALVMAVARRLPVVFVCENNEWSEMTPIAAIAPVKNLADRAPAYGLHGETIDGNDPQCVAEAIAAAAERARRGGGPSFVECKTVRLMGHYQADLEHYRDSADRESSALRDPLPRLRHRLLEDGLADEAAILELEEALTADVLAASQQALAEPPPDPATAASHVYFAETVTATPPEPTGDATSLTLAAALNEALRRELAENPEVIVFGEDIAIPGGVFGITRRLYRDFGGERVFDTPIAESAILGAALGAAQEGFRPIVEIMYSDFLLVALDQLVNQAANVRYLHGGRRSAPMVVRCQQGATPGSCAQHSQSLEALLAHIPGLKVGMASNPHDAYAMLRAAVHDPDPVVVIESRALYGVEGPVYPDAPIERVGGARLRRPGSDALIVSWGRMVGEAEAAAEELSAAGIDAAILDLRWLSPLDDSALIDLSRKLRRVLVVHEANLTGGFGAEVAARVAEQAFGELAAPVMRLATPDVRMPAAPVLQNALLPSRSTIGDAVRRLVGT
jgi:2-oxoisovalerate dehydrogenase E1 component